MKTTLKVLLFFAFLGFFGPQQSKAQGNLQFNQVIFYDIPYGSTQSFTVPAGKVWKVESVGTAVSGCGVYLQNSSAQNIGILYYISTSNYSPSLPMWLATGQSG